MECPALLQNRIACFYKAVKSGQTTRHQVKLLMSVAVLVGIAGCATGPDFQTASAPPPDAARVYVYRLKHYNPWAGLVPNATPYRITVNDGRVVDLSNDGYYSFLARPGANTLGSSMKYSH